jgi:eukaryotic-like serine/threonine-protein kinase
MQPAVSSAQVFKFGLFEADVARSTLTRSGVRVKIQDQPFRVLLLLLDHPGEIVTREELRHKLWPEGTYVDFDGSLNVILKKLRAAVDDDSDNPRFVETVPRRGYRFIAPVAMNGVKAELIALSNAAVQIPPVSTGGAVLAPSISQRRPLHLIDMFAALTLLVVVVAASFAWHRKQSAAKVPNGSAFPVASFPLRKSVAVLGFRNVSGRVNDTWLVTAFSEMLSTELAGGEKLRLISGEDVANLRLSSPWSQTDTLDQETTSRIGTALNSDLLVLGSFTATGQPGHGQVRLDVRLQDAKTGEILSEIAETGGAQDLFQLVSRIGSHLRERVGVPDLEDLDEAGVLASLPLNREAARFYSLGLAKLRQFDALAAKDLLQEACAVDPKFSLAHLMLARAWAQLGYEQKRKEEAKKSLDLSTDLPRIGRLLVQGDYYESLADHEKAASTYRVLLELFPDSVEYGLHLSDAQAAAGHGSQALETLHQLRRLPLPSSGDPRIDLAEAKIVKSNVDALTLIRKALTEFSSRGQKLFYAQARRDECLILIYGDRPELGPASCEEAYNIFLSAGNRLGAADSLRLIGDRQGAEGRLEEAIATYQRALKVLEGMGEHEKTGAILNNMAINFANQGKLDRAEQFYREAKSHFEQTGDQRNVAIALSNIADTFYMRGDLTGAAKLYEQGLRVLTLVDPSEPGYFLYRLADVELAQGRVQEAHDRAEKALAAFRPENGGYQYATGAMIVLGEVLEAEGDLTGARQQYEQTLAMRQKVGEMGLVQESQAELADLALQEGRPEQAEPLLRGAIAEFEKEKGDPDASGAYTLLSRALLMQGKVEEARKAVERATALSLTSSDPTLKLPAAIQSARVAIASTSNNTVSSSVSAARQELRSAVTTARKLGYYNLECEARLALSEQELKSNPASGRAQLAVLATETRGHGLELLARHAEQAIAASGTVLAANKPAR